MHGPDDIERMARRVGQVSRRRWDTQDSLCVFDDPDDLSARKRAQAHCLFGVCVYSMKGVKDKFQRKRFGPSVEMGPNNRISGMHNTAPLCVSVQTTVGAVLPVAMLRKRCSMAMVHR